MHVQKAYPIKTNRFWNDVAKMRNIKSTSFATTINDRFGDDAVTQM
jgi:hypothetical protein